MGSRLFLVRAACAAFLLGSFAGAGATTARTRMPLGGSDPASLRATRVDHSRLYYDASDLGTVWVRAKTYKASFGLEGGTYIPIFAATAPRNFPVAFALESVSRGAEKLAFDAQVAPQRIGDTIAYDRGAVRESYALALESMEQSFTFASLPGRGDLVLRIGLVSELSARIGSENIELVNEHGAVHYGRAVAIDAAGQRMDVETVLDGHSIELRLADQLLARAQFPLTIDPIVSAFPIATLPADHTLPDVGYAALSDQYLVVFEEQVSATDRDIFAILLDSAGAVIIGGYVDMTSAFWAHPSTASHRTSDQFLVAAAVGLPGSGARIIRGRTVAASTFAMGAAFTISGAESGDKSNPDVGGDPDFIVGVGTYYCVVWERALSQTNHDIHARLVTSIGTLFGASTILLDNSTGTLDTEPAISESNGASAGGPKNWNIVWQRQVSPGDHDIHGAQISWQGAITTPSFGVIVDPAYDDTHPDVASPLDNDPGGASVPRYYLIVAERDTATAHLNIGWLMVGASPFDQKNLSVLDGGNTFTDTLHPATDSDGHCFAVAYSEPESPGSTNLNVSVSSFTPVGTHLFGSEDHLTLAMSASPEGNADIVAQKSGGGSGPRYMAVWDDATGGGTLGDIEGALYDCGPFTPYCRPGSDGVSACPCGNPPALGPEIRGCNNSSGAGGASLRASGTPSVSADTALLTTMDEKPTALSIFAQGNALVSAGLVFGQGVRCVGGSLKRLYTKTASGGSASAPIGADPSIHVRSAALGDPIAAGSLRYYYVYYRDATVLGGCPSNSTFNATNAVQAMWMP